METKTETAILGFIRIIGLYRGNLGIMEENMETTLMGYIWI